MHGYDDDITRDLVFSFIFIAVERNTRSKYHSSYHWLKGKKTNFTFI